MKHLILILMVAVCSLTVSHVKGSVDDQSPPSTEQVQNENLIAQVADTAVAPSEDLDEIVDQAIEHWEDRPEKGDPIAIIIGWAVAAISILVNVIQYFKNKAPTKN